MRSEPPTGDELTRMLVSMKRNVLEQVASEPAPAKRSSATRRIIGLGLGLTLLLGVGAGAAFALGIVPSPSDEATAPVATRTATPTPEPTSTPAPPPTSAPAPPTEYVAEPGQPASRYSFDCGTLVDPALVSDLFTTAVDPSDPIVTASGVGMAIPRTTSILSVGGTVCEWSNGKPTNSQYGWEPDYVGVAVSVLPQPASGWSERAVQFGMPEDRSSCDELGCSGSTAVGDAWVTIEATGGERSALNASAWQPLVDAVVEAVSAAAPAGPPPFVERMSYPGTEVCEALIPLEQVQALTSAPQAYVRWLGGGGWSEWAEAQLYAGDVGCSWAVEDDNVASVDWVHGGRWAYERMLLAGTATPVELSGLSSGDSAVIRCDEEFGWCGVDLAVGRDWYNVVAPDRDTAIAVAEVMLAHSLK